MATLEASKQSGKPVLAAVTSGQEVPTTVEVTETYESKEEDMDTVKDVVCGMEIDPESGAAKMDHLGKTYHFCSSGCHEKFMAEPEKYVGR